MSAERVNTLSPAARLKFACIVKSLMECLEDTNSPQNNIVKHTSRDRDQSAVQVYLHRPHQEGHVDMSIVYICIWHPFTHDHSPAMCTGPFLLLLLKDPGTRLV